MQLHMQDHTLEIYAISDLHCDHEVGLAIMVHNNLQHHNLAWAIMELKATIWPQPEVSWQLPQIAEPSLTICEFAFALLPQLNARWVHELPCFEDKETNTRRVLLVAGDVSNDIQRVR